MADLIDREKLKKDMCASCAEFDECVGPLKDYCWAMHNIDEQPAVGPWKHGKWTKHDWSDIEDGFLINNYTCSQCGIWVKVDSKFCPNCGAMMDGMVEDETD